MMNDTLAISKDVNISEVEMNGERYFKISNSNEIRPFFMTIVSDSNHWMFISSNGGLTAGRKNVDFALFPYYTDDKIIENAENTGSKSVFIVQRNAENVVWEPFTKSANQIFKITQNLYKSVYGNKVVFQEINHDLELEFQYEWSSSDAFGFVKTSKLVNHSTVHQNIKLLDGFQNIIPFGVDAELQNKYSNLVDAYKRNELEQNVGLGIYALSAIIVDKAEPSEALKATTVWSKGLENPTYLLSNSQLKKFKNVGIVSKETDIKGEKGAYLVHSEVELNPNQEKEWYIVAEVNQSQSKVSTLIKSLKEESNLIEQLNENINLGTKRLIELNAQADALQITSGKRKDARHFSNTLFNIMRGGIFDDHYDIEKQDFISYLQKANTNVLSSNQKQLDALPKKFNINDLKSLVKHSQDVDFKRLVTEYLPLKFSRRHGDPSRPWNRFSINTKNEIDDSKVLDYEGNWRDIFQNWEALALSYPAFLEGMIFRFLNASTADGYNPYRITKDGFDWEIIEPDDPWSYIGYWGDHQIIYLLKLLELYEKHQPKALMDLFTQNAFVFANVPYKIKPYEDILKNPKDTIDFDEILDAEIRDERKKVGADASLLKHKNNEIVSVNFIEKILVTVLTKLSNFVPEAGIWMNTQRPEWNDANNALVGNGASMVTLYYIIRCLKFLQNSIENSRVEDIEISEELSEFFDKILKTFLENKKLLTEGFSDQSRKEIVDLLGLAGSDYRESLYKQGFSGEKHQLSILRIQNFLEIALEYLEHSAHKNRRNDGMYHSYNLISIENGSEISVDYLEEMLEGQVAVLSSGLLKSKEALEVLDALKNSKLFRPDQYSYLLYPNKELKGFLEKNNIPEEAIELSKLLKTLIKNGDTTIVEKDAFSKVHFNGNFRNSTDLEITLDGLNGNLKPLVQKEKQQILDLYEKVFNHKAFTGRSGTFFGYEGLGSIYWHMVSKLLLATQECCLNAIKNGERDEIVGKLLEHYYEIQEGIGVHKSPKLYGAFSTDAYSHTPAGKGAQQPGMTGQVKEDILSRFGELGVFVNNGCVEFNPCLLRKSEFVEENTLFKTINLKSEIIEFELEKGMLGFTYCQVPISYKISNQNKLVIHLNNGETIEQNHLKLERNHSQQLFDRTGMIRHISVNINSEILK